MKLKNLGKKIISIEIDEKRIKVFFGKATKAGIRVLDSFMVNTPNGSVSDGRLINIGEVEGVIAQELASRKIRNGLMSFSFKSSTYQEREITLPNVSPKELPAMVEYEIQQYLPFDVSKYAVEYKVNRTVIKDAQEFKELNVTAIEKSIIKPYLNLCKRLGFKPYKFDINTNSLDKLVSLSKEGPGFGVKTKQIAIVEFGYASSTVSIFNNGEQKISQTVEFGASNIITALRDNDEINNEKWFENVSKNSDFSKINEEQSERILKNENFLRILGIGNNEILSIFRYYMSRDEFNKVDVMYMYGPLSQLKGISSILERTFMVPVKQVNTFSFSREFYGLDFINYLNNIGALINVDGIRQYNFFRAFDKKSTGNFYYLLGVIFLATAILSTYTYFNAQIYKLEDRNDSLKKQVAILLGEDHITNSKGLEEKLSEAEAIEEYIAIYRYFDELYNIVPREYLDTVVDAIPELLYFETWTSSFEYNKVTGVTYDYSLLSEFEINLREAGFEFTHIRHITEDAEVSGKFYFEIHFNEEEVVDYE